MKHYRVSFVGLLAVTLSAALCGVGRAQGEKPTPSIVYRLGPDAQVGLTALAKGGHIPLTYSAHGHTSSTVVLVGGQSVAFGTSNGDWRVKPTALANGKDSRVRHGHWCVWQVGNIKFTQVVEILPSHTGKLDTCLIFYVLENGDSRAHDVGLRTMIDTQIASNDGNSFGLGGRAITRAADFNTPKDIPTVLEVRETSDPKRPGFVAQLTVKVGGTFEAPDRCSLTHWPGPSHSWDVPMENIDGDAAVALYWNPRRLEAGGRRLIGYAYGLGVLNLGNTAR